MEKIVTKSPEETKKLASDLAKELRGGDILFLFGDLGAGKTTFTQGLAYSLGIIHRIVSPTFIIMRSYDVAKNPELEKFYHIDLYRTQNESDIESAGVFEILGMRNTVTVVEWPEKMKTNIPQKKIEVRFKRISDEKREITIEKYE